MSDVKAIEKQLKIKSGVAKRLFKEHNMYQQEAVENKIKLEKMKAEGVEEEWYLRNAEKVLNESYKMIEDSSGRLGKAVGELRDLVNSVKTRTDMSENGELLAADGVLEEVSV